MARSTYAEGGVAGQPLCATCLAGMRRRRHGPLVPPAAVTEDGGDDGAEDAPETGEGLSTRQGRGLRR
eukprot:3126600-Lingulodinium_polyedra.AAC.1